MAPYDFHTALLFDPAPEWVMHLYYLALIGAGWVMSRKVVKE